MIRIDIIAYCIVISLLTGYAVAVNEVDIRSPVFEAIDGKQYDLDTSKFAGFFIDDESNFGTEILKIRVNEDKKLIKDYGVVYETTTKHEKFEFDDWGYFDSIGFNGEKYFAGYAEDTDFGCKIKQESLLAQESLSKMLFDSDMEFQLTKEKPFRLKEGYELGLSSANESAIYIILTKNGVPVDSEIVIPGKGKGSTYVYKKDDKDEEIIIIAVHFQNHFIGSDSDYRASCNGIFQISDEFEYLGQRIEKMTTRTVDKKTIEMRNADDITLMRNRNINLMGNFWIKAADQDTWDTNPLRFCIYKKETTPGTYIIRGPLVPILDGVNNWNAGSFAGLYYDLDNNIKTEDITFSITEGNQLDELTGVKYTTYPKKDTFSFDKWGNFSVIGFLGEKYFVSYADDSYLSSESNEIDLMKYEKLSKILRDNNEELTLKEHQTLWLGEGYRLTINSINSDGNKVALELSKDGNVVDTNKIISTSRDNLKDKTYCYRKDIGNCKGIAIISVHFKNAFRGGDYNLTTIDGAWQISENAKDIRVGTEYDKMDISSLENGEITMTNKDHISLIRRNQPLMENIAIRTLDDLDGEIRYFYIYREDTVEIGPHLGIGGAIHSTRKGLT